MLDPTEGKAGASPCRVPLGAITIAPNEVLSVRAQDNERLFPCRFLIWRPLRKHRITAWQEAARGVREQPQTLRTLADGSERLAVSERPQATGCGASEE